MKPCLRRLCLLLPAGVLILMLGTIAAACTSDDDELTLEEFFQQGAAKDDDFEERIEGVYEGFPDDGQETDENLESTKASYGEFAALYDDFFDELETLNPPSEAEDAFDELINAGRDIVEFVEDFAGRVDGVESFTELGELLDESDAESASIEEAYRAACQSLQVVADSNGIVANIGCADDF